MKCPSHWQQAISLWQEAFHAYGWSSSVSTVINETYYGLMHVILWCGLLILDWPDKYVLLFSSPASLLTLFLPCDTPVKKETFSSSDIQVAKFQKGAKDLLCDNWSCLLATGVQVYVLREWHMDLCVCVCIRVGVVGGFHLSSALRPI